MKKLASALGGLLMVFNTNAASAAEALATPELSKKSIEMLNHYGIQKGHLQFDQLRERDRTGENYCVDANDDGWADIKGNYLEQDDTRFSSTLIAENGEKIFLKKQSRGDFIQSLENHPDKNVTGILNFPAGGALGPNHFPVMFASKKEGEVVVARINSRQPLGEMSQFQKCDNLKQGAKKSGATTWNNDFNPF